MAFRFIDVRTAFVVIVLCLLPFLGEFIYYSALEKGTENTEKMKVQSLSGEDTEDRSRGR